LARTFVTYLSKPSLELMQDYSEQHAEFSDADSQALAQIIIGSVVYMCLTQYILHGRDIMPLSKERYMETMIGLMLKSTRTDVAHQP